MQRSSSGQLAERECGSMRRNRMLNLPVTAGVLALAAAAVIPANQQAGAESASTAAAKAASSPATPIQHLVVIFQENVSFDHYFGTYPKAANQPGETTFTPASGTPTVNGLTDALLTANPNSSNPQRLSPSQPLTCDQDHDYGPEQSAFDHGLMDRFIETVGSSGTSANN